MVLTLLRNTVGANLGVASPVAVPFGEPVAQTRAHVVERIDQVETDIWKCTLGYQRRQIVEQRFYHFLQGRCVLTPDGSETIRIEADDALLLPENSLGVWDVQETVCRSYMIIHHQPTQRNGVI